MSIKKVKGGYQNIGAHGKHSNKPMTHAKALSQIRAMGASGFFAREAAKGRMHRGKRGQ